LGKPRHNEQHQPALPYARTAEFILALGKRGGDSARALEFLILTAARPGEVRGATWSEFDFDKKLWTIPAERMKEDRIHRVPLSGMAIALLKRQQKAGRKVYPFANTKGDPLSDAALPKLIKDMYAADVKAGGVGYLDPNYGEIAVPHGFRSAMKDWARSETQYADEVAGSTRKQIADAIPLIVSQGVTACHGRTGERKGRQPASPIQVIDDTS
jgi:integrase